MGVTSSHGSFGECITQVAHSVSFITMPKAVPPEPLTHGLQRAPPAKTQSIDHLFLQCQGTAANALPGHHQQCHAERSVAVVRALKVTSAASDKLCAWRDTRLPRLHPHSCTGAIRLTMLSVPTAGGYVLVAEARPSHRPHTHRVHICQHTHTPTFLVCWIASPLSTDGL